MKYKICINNSNYNEWKWINEEDQSLIDLSINSVDLSLNPFHRKLFNDDILDENLEIIYSSIRNSTFLCGILLLSGKTYGRHKNGKFYYKCIPSNKTLPPFLIPYQFKKPSFHKNLINKYILFKFSSWNEKHPIGLIIETIGDISIPENFYQYLLYSNNLHFTLKEFSSKSSLLNSTFDPSLLQTIFKYSNILNRLDHNIISIDPNGSTDIDDAIGFHNNIISIYISNVPIIMEYLNLWEFFSERISTIYCPHKKLPMLPITLSENICSLLQNEQRFSFCMDIHLDYQNSNVSIKKIEFNTVLISVSQNYSYDDKELHNDKIYTDIRNISQKLNNNLNYLPEILDSHHLISFLMIFMNHECAKKLSSFKDGIYRSASISKSSQSISHIPNDIKNFIKIWQSSSGFYSNFNNRQKHELISNNIDYYTHITSPIRRIVDLLNMMKLQNNLGLFKMSDKAEDFYKKWMSKLDYVNNTTQSIRKVQSDCNLLSLCTSNESIINKTYQGYLFDKIQKENHNSCQYSVYIPKINIISRISSNQIFPDYTSKIFKIFIFEDGITLHKKIRLSMEN